MSLKTAILCQHLLVMLINEVFYFTFRQVYVMEHFPFYSSLLVEFLVRAFQLNLMSDHEVFLLYRVSKVRMCVILNN